MISERSWMLLEKKGNNKCSITTLNGEYHTQWIYTEFAGFWICSGRESSRTEIRSCYGEDISLEVFSSRDTRNCSKAYPTFWWYWRKGTNISLYETLICCFHKDLDSFVRKCFCLIIKRNWKFAFDLGEVAIEHTPSKCGGSPCHV